MREVFMHLSTSTSSFHQFRHTHPPLLPSAHSAQSLSRGSTEHLDTIKTHRTVWSVSVVLCTELQSMLEEPLRLALGGIGGFRPIHEDSGRGICERERERERERTSRRDDCTGISVAKWWSSLPIITLHPWCKTNPNQSDSHRELIIITRTVCHSQNHFHLILLTLLRLSVVMKDSVGISASTLATNTEAKVSGFFFTCPPSVHSKQTSGNNKQ